MDLQPQGRDKLVELLQKGVAIPNPLMLDIGDEVNVGRISGENVILYPGCRIYGSKTVISAGVKLGYEGPVTVDDCRLGPGWSSREAPSRDRSSWRSPLWARGAGARGVSAGRGGEWVPMRGSQTDHPVPFRHSGKPDQLLRLSDGWGTSRTDHSEVGSSYIHFNYTPDGDKARPLSSAMYPAV